MKRILWSALALLGTSLTFTSSAFSAPILPVGAGACQTRNEALLEKNLPMVWKNARDTPVQILLSYKDPAGAWLEEALIVEPLGEVALTIASRCVYWYALRGEAFYGPKVEKDNASEVFFTLEDREVQAIALDLKSREGLASFTMTLR